MAIDTGNGATIAFGTSGFTAAYIEIGGLNESRPVLNKSSLSTTGHEEYCPGDLLSIDGVNCRFFWDPTSQPPVTAAVETVTITLPNGTTLSGTAFISSRSGASLANNQLMTGEFTLQFDGVTGPAYSGP